MVAAPCCSCQGVTTDKQVCFLSPEYLLKTLENPGNTVFLCTCNGNKKQVFWFLQLKYILPRPSQNQITWESLPHLTSQGCVIQQCSSMGKAKCHFLSGLVKSSGASHQCLKPSVYTLVTAPHLYDDKCSPAIQGLEKSAFLQAYCMYRKPRQAHAHSWIERGLNQG